MSTAALPPDPITKRDVEIRTTLIDADGRVVERPDGNRLLIDAYNVLHRDFDKVLLERQQLQDECQQLRVQMRQNEIKYETNGAVITAEATSRLQALADEVSKLTQQVARLEQENASLHACGDAIGSFRSSMGEAVTRLFRSSAEDHLPPADDTGGSPFCHPSSPGAQPSLTNELRLLSRAKDQLLIILTAAATSHRQSASTVTRLTTERETAHSVASLYKVQVDEASLRAAISADCVEGFVSLLGKAWKESRTASPSPLPLSATPSSEALKVSKATTGTHCGNKRSSRKQKSSTSSPRRHEPVELGVILEVGGKVIVSSNNALQPGDLLMSADGKTIITQQDLTNVVSSSTSGVVACRLRRNGVVKTVEFPLHGGAAELSVAAPPPAGAAPSTRPSGSSSKRRSQKSVSLSQTAPRSSTKLKQFRATSGGK